MKRTSLTLRRALLCLVLADSPRSGFARSHLRPRPRSQWIRGAKRSGQSRQHRTSVAVQATTNDAGNYALPFLLPGIYDVSAELTGFKKLERKGVEVRVNDSVNLELQMMVGDVTQSLEVNASTPLLETGSVSLGQVVDRERLIYLPFQSGNPAELAKSAPGSVSVSSWESRRRRSITDFPRWSQMETQRIPMSS